MSLSTLQQTRLLYWARRLRDSATGTGAALVDREIDALGKLIKECDQIINPPAPPGVHDKNGNTR